MRAGTRSERRSGLETGNVSVDLPSIWGRRARLGKRATEAPRRLTGVLALARMEDQESSNTGNPVGAKAHGNRTFVRSRLGRQGGGWVRSTVEVE
ncbi:MAG: hypothetical protein F4100_12975 [Rhodothermaceae bacterium]|nr:hypothetical protein [Rhodothermaceae bacterium]